ncbi:Hsp70 family protein, partial [bacterium]|nr:Hsp70 family protein [bacterium]
EAHAEEDKAKKELIEAKNQASSVAFDMEKQLKEYGDKLEEADRKEIADNIEALKKLAESDSTTKEELEKGIEDTMKSAQKIGEAMQKAQAQQQANQAAPEQGAQAESSDKATEGEEVQEGEVVS